MSVLLNPDNGQGPIVEAVGQALLTRPFGDEPREEAHQALAREVLDALGFEAGEDLAGPIRDLARKTGEARDVDAV